MRRSPGSRRSERGASVVEYALGVAFIVIGSMGGLSVLQDKSEAHLRARASDAGAPADEAMRGVVAGSGSSSADGTSGTPPSGTANVQITGMTGNSTNNAGENIKWDAIVTVTIVDADGNPAAGVAIAGTWTNGRGSGGESCVTDAGGLCTLVREAIRDNHETVSFSLVSIGDGVTIVYSPQPADPTGVTITCTSAVC